MVPQKSSAPQSSYLQVSLEQRAAKWSVAKPVKTSKTSQKMKNSQKQQEQSKTVKNSQKQRQDQAGGWRWSCCLWDQSLRSFDVQNISCCGVCCPSQCQLALHCTAKATHWAFVLLSFLSFCPLQCQLELHYTAKAIHWAFILLSFLSFCTSQCQLALHYTAKAMHWAFVLLSFTVSAWTALHSKSTTYYITKAETAAAEANVQSWRNRVCEWWQGRRGIFNQH